MKKTQLIEILHNIRNSKISFIAIILFVTLGVAIFTGFGWSGKAFIASVNTEYNAYNFHNYELTFPYGFSREDLEKIDEVPDVDHAQGLYSSFQFFYLDDIKTQAKVVSLTKDADVLSQVEGTLPQRSGEIAVQKNWAKNNGVKVGDTITFKHDGDKQSHFLYNLMHENYEELLTDDVSKMKYLKTDTFTVTALAESTAYMSAFSVSYGASTIKATPIDCIMFVDEKSFDKKAFLGYNTVIVRTDSLRANMFNSDEYKYASDSIKTKLQQTVDKLADSKCDRIEKKRKDCIDHYGLKVELADAELSDAKSEINLSKAEVRKKRKEIEKQEEALTAYPVKLDSIRAEITTKSNELKSAKSQAEDLAASLEAEESQLSKKRQQYALEQAKILLKQRQIEKETSEIESARQEATMNPSDEADESQQALTELIQASQARQQILEQEIEESRAQQETLTTEIEEITKKIQALSGEIEKVSGQMKTLEGVITNKEAEFSFVQTEYSSKVSAINAALIAIGDTDNLISAAEGNLASGEEKVQLAKKQHNKLVKALSGIKRYDANISARDSNGAAVSASTVADLYSKLKYNLASLFMVIGLLVCYSAISRMVYTHRKLIGTKKALGLRKGEITSTYLIYAGTAALIGVVLGALIGSFVIERVFLDVLKNSYLIESTTYYYSIKEVLILAALEMGLSLAAAYIACHRMLNRTARDLIDDLSATRSHERLFEKTGLWKRLPLLSKTIINNFFNDTRRVFAMVVGAAGCTALVVCGMLFIYMIDGSFERQYEKIQSFDTVISYDSAVKTCDDEIREVLDEEGINYTQAYSSMGSLKSGGDKAPTYLFAFKNDDAANVLNLYTMDGRQHDLDDEIWVSYAFAKYYNLHHGDNLYFTDVNGKEHELKLGKAYEFYLARPQIVMSYNAYKDYFGKKPTTNAFIFSREDVSISELSDKLDSIDGYIFTDDFHARSKSTFDVVGSVSKAAAGVFLALSIVMALLIQLNLLTVFVEEKKRELITLMVNGYSLSYAKKYIYSDTIFITIIGIIIGIAVGIFMGKWNVNSLISEYCYFINDIDIISCITGIIVTVLLTIVMSLIALRRIKKFKLSELGEL